MISHRKKDYFQRILEEFFRRLHDLINKSPDDNGEDKRNLINDAFGFFSENFDVHKSDSMDDVMKKIGYNELIEQYARLLYTEYTIVDIKYKENLLSALYLVEYLQRTDLSFSWERTILREDILRLIDQDNNK